MIIEGTIYWCKLDKLRDNYNKQRKIMKDGEPDGWGREWTVTLGNLTKETKLKLRDAGLLDRVKNKMDDQEDHMTFRLSEFKRNGEANDPVVVTDAKTGKDWDWKTQGLIGNGSKGAMKFNVWKGGAGKASIFPVALLVLEHELYEAEDNGSSYEDPNDWSDYAVGSAAKEAPATKAKSAKKPAMADDLDDDIPF